MHILGISAFYHDSAAVLIKDGVVISAIEEERFSRKKHDNAFPFKAIDWCLRENNIKINDLHAVSYYEKPLLKFERILEMFIETYPRSLFPFIKSIPEWLGEKIRVESIVKNKLGYKKQIFYVPHHLSHAACGFYPSPFKDSAILTIDGVGEYQTTGLWLGKDKTITPLKSIDFPHSIGLLYSTFTAYLGFQVNNDEYKMMGLSAYGKPKYVSKVWKLIDQKADGSFHLNMKFFSFRETFQMWSRDFENLFGSPRKKTEPFTKRHKDIASSIQIVTEEVIFSILRELHKITGSNNLCLHGGVALNSLANGKITQNTPFKKVYALGAAGDNGAALGAALYLYHEKNKHSKRTTLDHLYLGPSYSDKQIHEVLKKSGLKFIKVTNEERINLAVKLLSENKIIGWFQGRMEFGPRALGSRSILANPRDRSMKDRVNRIKMREEFRPFAASVLEEQVQELFEVPEKSFHSPFMNFVFPVKKERRQDIRSIVHADNTCRIQTVNKKTNSLYYDLIKTFYEKTGIPCVLNTSFNTKIEPIVESPEQAFFDFRNTKLYALFIGDYFLKK